MLFLLLGLKGGGEGEWLTNAHPDKPSVLHAKMNRQHRCGAMKPQPTQTYADNQNKHIAKLFCA